VLLWSEPSLGARQLHPHSHKLSTETLRSRPCTCTLHFLLTHGVADPGNHDCFLTRPLSFIFSLTLRLSSLLLSAPAHLPRRVASLVPSFADPRKHSRLPFRIVQYYNPPNRQLSAIEDDRVTNTPRLAGSRSASWTSGRRNSSLSAFPSPRSAFPRRSSSRAYTNSHTRIVETNHGRYIGDYLIILQARPLRVTRPPSQLDPANKAIVFL
jgi:hypothetical protein